jgi:hypothetical protein
MSRFAEQRELKVRIQATEETHNNRYMQMSEITYASMSCKACQAGQPWLTRWRHTQK